MDQLSSIMSMGGRTPGTFPSSGGSGSSSGGWLNTLLPMIMLGSAGLGTVGNIQANSARNKVLNAEMDQMSKLSKMTPSQLAAGISALQQPLSNSLVSNVGNAVQGQMAERGLAQAPGVYSTVLSQALAPYQLQEQQLATNAYLQQLGLPISARPSPFGPFPESTNTSAIWQSLFNRFYQPNNGSAPNPAVLAANSAIQGTGLTPTPSTPIGYGGLDYSNAAIPSGGFDTSIFNLGAS